jgi:hypothetical protein
VAGGSRIRIELSGVNLADCCLIMIPSNAYVVVLTQKLDALIWVRAIANNISQAPNFFRFSLAFNIIQYRSKSS